MDHIKAQRRLYDYYVWCKLCTREGSKACVSSTTMRQGRSMY